MISNVCFYFTLERLSVIFNFFCAGRTVIYYLDFSGDLGFELMTFGTEHVLAPQPPKNIDFRYSFVLEQLPSKML